jgi:hypothetical protein
MDFRINVVDLEGDCFFDDDEQKQIEGVYLEYVGIGEEKKELSDKTKKTLDGLKMAVEKTKVDGKKYTLEEKDHFVVTLEQWKPFAFECYAVKNTGRHAGWFRDGVKILIEQGLVENNGQWYWEKI